MSTEHTDPVPARLYRALADEAGHVPLDPPAAVRARADRQARARATLAVTTAAVVVAAVATGAGGLLRDGGTTRVTPAPQVTTDPPPAPSAVPVPASVPDAAFLTDAEVDAFSGVAETAPETERLLDLCGTDVRPTAGARAHRRFGADLGRGIAVYQQEVTLYASPAAARAYLDHLRDAVAACPLRRAAAGIARFRLLDPPDLGADAVLIEQRVPAYEYVSGTAVPGRFATFYTGAVRHGDAVTVLDTGDYEASSLELADVVPRLVRAAERLATWRGEAGG